MVAIILLWLFAAVGRAYDENRHNRFGYTVSSRMIHGIRTSVYL